MTDEQQARIVEAVLSGRKVVQCKHGHGQFLTWPWPEAPSTSIEMRKECPFCIVKLDDRQRRDADVVTYVDSFVRAARLAVKEQA